MTAEIRTVNKTAKENQWWRSLSPNMVFVISIGFWVMIVLLGVIFGDPYPDGWVQTYPETTVSPPFAWVFNYLIPLGSTVFFIWATLDSAKKKSFTYAWLFFVAGASTFWAESIGDWAFGLTYSPAFIGYNWPIDFPWHVAHNPFFMPFAYGFYWGTHGFLMTALLKWWRKRKNMSELKSILLFAVPFGFAWDFLVEGTATYFGWWQYLPVIGPHVSWPSGGNMPLVVPILFPMVFWPNWLVWFCGDPAKSLYKLGRIEQLFNLQKLLPDTHPASPNYIGITGAAPEKFAWKYEIFRWVGWMAVFWVSMFFTQLVPLILLRYGVHMVSPFSPFPVK